MRVINAFLQGSKSASKVEICRAVNWAEKIVVDHAILSLILDEKVVFWFDEKGEIAIKEKK